MSLLHRIVYAAHARGSHHKLALDALERLPGPDAERWRRVFLKHAEAYLDGSKAPDTSFKDFKNHVLHVREGYWGGAIEATRDWYDRLVDALKKGRWPEAVYSAGVLSHYVVDPLHPFHTGQSDAESNIHRAVEWSIAKSYDALKSLPVEVPAPQTEDGHDWLARLLCAGAERANRDYHTLLVHYDFAKGVIDPPAGLDRTAGRAVAGLISHAVATFATVLDRAIRESGATPPEVSLTLDTLLATLAVPRKWVLNRIEDGAERRQVEAMYDELQATGTVKETLSEDDRTVRELHAVEVQHAIAQRQAAARTERIRRAASPLPTPEPAEASARTPVLSAEGAAEPDRRLRLAADDPVEAAPSVGPKTAERLGTAGVSTVAELVAADPRSLSERLAVRHIDEALVRSWQHQARLALAIPGLNGTNAQLLVAAGYRSIEDLGSARPADVEAALLAVRQSPAGERILRGGSLPSDRMIASWIEAARDHPAKAA